MAETPTTPTQKENPQDILIVRNIDTDCNHVEYQTARRSTRTVDDEGRVTSGYTDDVEEVPHNLYFQVKWSGQRFRIKPGDTRLYPRYIAEHFAKHLTDHMLARQEFKSKQTGKEISLINSPTERKKQWDLIIPGVQQYFEDLGTIDEGVAAGNQVEELNASPMAAELGIATGNHTELREDREVQVVNKDPMATGVSNAVTPTEELIAKAIDDPNEPAPAGSDPEAWANTTKADLIGQIRKLDPFAQLTGQESKGQLMSKLKGF
jgi:hypothetical protein